MEMVGLVDNRLRILDHGRSEYGVIWRRKSILVLKMLQKLGNHGFNMGGEVRGFILDLTML
jgi:hypothetical protein